MLDCCNSALHLNILLLSPPDSFGVPKKIKKEERKKKKRKKLKNKKIISEVLAFSKLTAVF